jgi:hypothetical protein
MSGDTNFNQPPPVSYGEGMAEAMQAQMEQLLGQGEYADIYRKAGFEGGNLGDILAGVEAPIRKQTAQIDTDVLRQTLLGSEQQTTQDPDTGKWGIAGTEVVKNDKGESLESSEGRYQIIQTTPYREGSAGGPRGGATQSSNAQYSIIDTQTGGLQNVPGQAESGSWGSGPDTTNLKLVTSRFNELQSELRASEEPESETVTTFTFSNPNIPADPDKAGQAGYDDMGRRLLRKGDTARTTTGMVDLVGDTRQVQQAVRSEDYASYVRDNPDLSEQFAAARAEGDERTIEQFGKQHYEDFGKAEGREIKGTYDMEEGGRRAGFDERGDFLGLSAFGEDIQAGNLSRQRQRDLEDVARLSPLYSDIMDEYKPGTKQAITDARKVLEAQKGTLTGAGAIDAPASVAGSMGNITSGGIDASLAKRIDPLAAETGYTPSAAVAGGNIEADALRKALMKDAETSLAAGLTPREQEQIEQASRRRATALGRAFDRGSIADEVQSRVLEDRNRQAQNRAYAQQVLGQEAGLQESDLGRGLQASLANQQATNRAAEFGVGSGMQQEQAQAQIDFQTSLANQAALQDAAKFSAQEKMQAQLANEANRQQASSFDVSAKMDQQRLNEQLKQQGTLGYVDAATRLAALEDTSTLDPFQAVLGRAGGGSLQAGQGVFGQAKYGLQSAPQYLDPSAGLGYIQAQNANQASMYNAQLGANATRQAGMFGGLGSLGGGLMGAAFGKGGFLR